MGSGLLSLILIPLSLHPPPFLSHTHFPLPPTTLFSLRWPSTVCFHYVLAVFCLVRFFSELKPWPCFHSRNTVLPLTAALISFPQSSSPSAACFQRKKKHPEADRSLLSRSPQAQVLVSAGFRRTFSTICHGCLGPCCAGTWRAHTTERGGPGNSQLS